MTADRIDPLAGSETTGSGTAGHAMSGASATGADYTPPPAVAGRDAFDRDDRTDSIRERGEALLDAGREKGRELVEDGRETVEHAADEGRNRVAGKLSEFGDRLEERGREYRDRGGVQGRAGEAAVRAGGALDSGAEYLRSHDMDDMRDDLERQIRGRPLVSVGVALGAGFLLGRMLRD
jgi:ElaB/YqjD/DUF883 family membrane-anchored ribosome-binding protein